MQIGANVASSASRLCVSDEISFGY
jgi:hypothetical protein